MKTLPIKAMRALPSLFAAALVASACTSPIDPVVACTSNDQCPSGMLCFAEGCGDPGNHIVVEIQGAASTSYRAADFNIADGTLGATQNFDLGTPLTLTGQLQREQTAGNATDRTAFTDGVTVRATGSSVLLPGIKRSFETTFDKPEFGFFAMSVGAGSFSITATPFEASVPPVSSSAVIGAGEKTSVTFVFPAADAAPAISGRLVRKIVNKEPVLISAPYYAINATPPEITLQLFDPTTNEALSQRFPISSTSGDFAMTVSPRARSLPHLALVASPSQPGVAVPSKRFLLDTPLPPALSLELGEYGDEGELTAQIVDRFGQPIVGAYVLLEGTVAGEGTFRSKIVSTNAEGEFKVTTLASRGENTFFITAVPPDGSAAAYTHKAVTVSVANGVAALNPGSTNANRVVLEDRLKVKGTVLQQNSTDTQRLGAAKVSVFAIPQTEEPSTTMVTEARALPVEPAQTITNDDGTFELSLDPGIWRFEFIAGGQVPLASRLVTVKAPINDKGETLSELTLNDVQLSWGRTVSGSITGIKGSQQSSGMGFSQLRFFRVTSIGGKPVSILLGSTIADESGRYSVVLPTANMDKAGAASP
ncbi:MAG: hypothetical protein U0228_11905 [Myxococcaceae bacterium]